MPTTKTMVCLGSTTTRTTGRVVVVLAMLLAAPWTSNGFTLRPTTSSPHDGGGGGVFRVVGRTVPCESAAASSTSNSVDIDTTTTTTIPHTIKKGDDYDPSHAFTAGEEAHVSLQQLKEQQEQRQAQQNQCLDLNGDPLSVQYFTEMMGLPNDDAAEYYSCHNTFHDFNSDACRVQLHPGGQTAFYKRIVFGDLEHARRKAKMAPEKLTRDVKSYQVVGAFLRSQACQLLTRTTQMVIPTAYHAKLEPCLDNPIASKFSFLLHDLHPSQGWHQEWLLSDHATCHAALRTYAAMHAFFWHNATFWRQHPDAAAELQDAVWESASYVQPQFQVGTCQKVASEWATKRLKFKAYLSKLDYWDNLGDRLESIAQECGRHAHPFADNELKGQYNKYRTFTHGDPKQANLLFRPRAKGQQLQVAMIDFQWAGFGLAATDIGHFMTSAVHADMLENGGEKLLLEYYFDQLQHYLVEYGAYPTKQKAMESYSYETFVNQYETEVLDICRLMIAYTWARFEEPVDKDNAAACARTMNKTSYNKSIPNIVWLLNKCDAILKSRGV